MNISPSVKKYINDNKDLLRVSSTEFLREAANSVLSIREIGQVMAILHNSGIECDFSIIPKFFDLMNYKFTFTDRENIITDLDDEIRPLAVSLQIDGINDFRPNVLHNRIINDKALSRCSIHDHDWSQAKEGPYLVTCGILIDESKNNINTSLSITTADLKASLEIHYPKICGKILDDVGYMYDKDMYNRQVSGFKDQLQRVVEE